MAESIPEDLITGTPVLEARWRLQNGALPLKNRHMRALQACGLGIGLMSWARQHIEWTLTEGTVELPDGVLVLDVDGEGRAVMNAEPYEPLPALSAALLLERAKGQEDRPVESEVVWVVRSGRLSALTPADKPLSGTNSLVCDLARTLHLEPDFEGHPEPADVLASLAPADECMLVSDEHGVVAAADHDGPVAANFVGYYARLLSTTKPDRMGQAVGR